MKINLSDVYTSHSIYNGIVSVFDERYLLIM